MVRSHSSEAVLSPNVYAIRGICFRSKAHPNALKTFDSSTTCARLKAHTHKNLDLHPSGVFSRSEQMKRSSALYADFAF